MELSRFVHDFWNSKAAYRRFLQPNNVEALPNGLAGIPDGLKRLQANKISGKKLIALPQETA